MRSTRESGQGSMELVGIVTVASLLVGSTVGVVVTQAPAIQNKICHSIQKIAGGVGCDDASDTASPDQDGPMPGDSGFPDSPPEPPDSPVCKPEGEDDGSQAPTGSVTVEHENEAPGGKQTSSVTIDFGDVQIDEDGRPWQTSSITTDVRLSAEAKRQMRGIGITGSVFAGASTTYGVTLPPSQSAALPDSTPPNPFDPRSIPVGGDVTLSARTYAGMDLEASYKGLRAGGGFEEGTEISTSVTRLSGNKVRVLVGPSDFLGENYHVGVGTDDINLNAEFSNEYSNYHLQQADFDLSTPSGRQAYYRMTLGGQVPEVDGNGVSNVATHGGSGYEHESGLSGKLKSLSGSIFGHHKTTDSSVTEYADGRLTYTGQYTEGGVSIISSQTLDANGNLDGDSSQYQIRMHDVDPDLVNRFNDYYGKSDATVDSPQNMVLSFDAGDFSEIESQAYQILAHSARTSGNDWEAVLGEDFTASDVRAFVYQMRKEGREDMISSLAVGNDAKQALAVINADNNFGVLLEMMYGDVSNVINPANTLTYLDLWHNAYETALGNDGGGPGPDDVDVPAGAGSTVCRGVS